MAKLAKRNSAMLMPESWRIRDGGMGDLFKRITNEAERSIQAKQYNFVGS
jgi:hypothetical protein